ncbi:MAG: hypothetical protein QM610_11225 [Chitinophagaceae bacterium]
MTKKYGILFILLLLLTACNSIQPLQTVISSPQPKLSDQEYIAVILPHDTAKIPENYIVGHVTTPQKGKSAIDGFDNIMHAYDSIAQRYGANLIRILHIRYATNLKESDKVAALLYRVPDIRQYEKKIFWNGRRKLVWDDFKGSIPDTLQGDTYSSYAHIGIQHRSNAAFLVGTDRFFVTSSFDCDKSWFRPYAYYQTSYLDFQQGLFDLTELYARKMRQKLTAKNIKEKDKAAFTENIDKELGQQYRDAENQYVMDTKAGTNKEAIQQWHDKIWKELRQ